MEKLEDCLEEIVKFTLRSRADFDLGLSDDFCFGLLADDPSHLADADTLAAGVPEYPLYKRLALGLLKSISSVSFCGAFEKMALMEEESWLSEKEDEWGSFIFQKGSELLNILDGLKTIEGNCFAANYDRLCRGSLVMVNKCLVFEVLEVHRYSSFYEMLKAETLGKVFPGVKTVEEGMELNMKLYKVEQEKSNGVVAIHVRKAVAQPCVILANILSELSYIGVQRLLGLSHTTGSIPHALPPPRSVLLSSFVLPYKPEVKGCTLSHGARALAKHVDRSSHRFWGVLHGSDSNKNRLATDIVSGLVARCCWMNIHTVQPHGQVFEIRVAEGYGARWSRDATKFIGFLEPYMEDGHSKCWKH